MASNQRPTPSQTVSPPQAVTAEKTADEKKPEEKKPEEKKPRKKSKVDHAKEHAKKRKSKKSVAPQKFDLKSNIEKQTTQAAEDEDSLFEFEDDEEEVVQKTPWWITRDMAENISREAVLACTIRAAAVFLVFYLSVYICTWSRRQSNGYQLFIAIKAPLIDNLFDTYNDQQITFEEIRSPEDFWAYLENHVVPMLYWKTYYYEDPDDPDTPVAMSEEDDRKVLYENLVLGTARLRQVRVANDSCYIHQYFRTLFSGCYDKYREEDRDTEAFGKMKGTAWTFNSEAKTQSVGCSGLIDSYDGSGYYQDFSMDEERTKYIIQDLYNNLWIDQSTRAVFLDWSMYNANMNLYCLVKLTFEFPTTGGIIPSSHIGIHKFDVGLRDESKLGFVAAVIIYIMSTYFLLEEIREIWFFKLVYFKQFWSYFDLATIVLIFADLWTSQIAFPSIFDLVDKIMDNPDDYGNLEYIGELKDTNNKICAWFFFSSTIKWFKYLNFNKAIGQLNGTLRTGIYDLFCFSCMFIMVFGAFAELGYLLFGTQAPDYKNFGTAMITLLRTVLGDFDYETIEKSNPVLAPIYFLSYIYLVFFVLLNMFLAIVNDKYCDVKTEMAIAEDELQMPEYIVNCFQNFLSKHGCYHTNKKEKQSKVVLAQIRNALLLCGFTNAEVDAFNTRYGNKENDLRKMVRELEARSNAVPKVEDTVFVRLVDFVMNDKIVAIQEKLANLMKQTQTEMTRLEKLEALFQSSS